MKTIVLLLVVVAGCVDEAAPTATLPSDAHYVQDDPPYASPEACVAQAANPFTCLHALTLCANGRAGLREGDLVDEGTYSMRGSVAQIETTNSSMQFDVQTVRELSAPNVPWIVDTHGLWETLQFDSISCE